MSEEIIYEDKRYKFYEDKIYGKTRFQYLRHRFNKNGRHWSFITIGNCKLLQMDYPISMENIQCIYLDKL
jgi:hypothetical protein